MLILIFLLAAAATLGGIYLVARGNFNSSLPLSGLVFMASSASSALIGITWFYLSRADQIRSAVAVSAEQVTAMPLIPHAFWESIGLVALTLAVYALSLLRGLFKLPPLAADVGVIVCATVAVTLVPNLAVSLAPSFGFPERMIESHWLQVLLTVMGIWATARFSAALNRLPSVAGGYLGIVSLTVLLLLFTNGQPYSFYPWATAAALAGGGMAAFVASLLFPKVNLGWSAVLAAGFSLGCATSLGLLKTAVPATATLALLTLGLPLLDVTFYRVRATLRGERVDWRQNRMRLHEALDVRGISPAKVSLLYLALGTWLCLLDYLATRWLFSSSLSWLAATCYVLILLALAASGATVFFSVARVLMRRQSGEQVPERVEAFGVNICPVSMEEALDKIDEFIAHGTPHHVVTSDANAILTSKRDPVYAEILSRAHLVTPDGFGVIWGARLLNLPIYERVTGVDMVTGICSGRRSTATASLFLVRRQAWRPKQLSGWLRLIPA